MQLLADTSPQLLALTRDKLFGLLLVGGIAFALYLTFRAATVRRRVWARFARRHRLTIEWQNKLPTISGQIKGRPFRMWVSPKGSDRGLLGIEEVAIALGINPGIPCDFTINNEGVVMTALREAMGDNRIAHLGEDRFDHETCVHTADPRTLNDYLSPARRDVVLELFDTCPACDLSITATEIQLRQRRSAATLREIEQLVHRVLKAAEAFDLESPTSAGVVTGTEP